MSRIRTVKGRYSPMGKRVNIRHPSTKSRRKTEKSATNKGRSETKPRRRLRSSDYTSLGRERGFRWVGTELPPNGKTKTEWECLQGHRWTAVYGNIRRGSGCPVCSRESSGRKRRLAGAYYDKLAKKRNFWWLGTEVPATAAKTEWQCPKKHKWTASYNSIERGSGCPKCGNLSSSEKRRLPADRYEALARKNGLRWLGQSVPNNKTATRWQCSKKHTWTATYGSIRRGSGCPLCARLVVSERQKLKPSDYKRLGRDNGLRWLGPEVSNTKTFTKWECQNKHVWQTYYNTIQQGHGCPKCARASGNKKRHAASTARGKSPQKHQREATHRNNRQGLDRANTARRLSSNDYHALARKRGYRWSGMDVPNARSKTDWQCGERHRWKASYSNIKQGSSCPDCSKESKRISPQAYRELAKSRKVHWLGPETPNTKTKTWWQCENEHKWQSTYGNIERGSGCPKCRQLAKSKKLSFGPSDYRKLARSRKIVWLGNTCVNTASKTKWQCPQKHIWSASYDKIRGGCGCPKCGVHIRSEKLRLPESAYYALAQKKKLLWLGPAVPNNATATRWECNKGHKWMATYASINDGPDKRGTGCPRCSWEILAQKLRIPKAGYEERAREKGHIWLGPLVKSANAPTKWQCSKNANHKWNASYSGLRGCPRCIEWNGETQLAHRIKKLFSRYRVERQARLPWLGRQHLDVFVPSLLVAFEYNGPQHYEAFDHFGGSEKLQATKRLDKLKRKLCKANGISLRVVPWNRTISDEQILAFVNKNRQRHN